MTRAGDDVVVRVRPHEALDRVEHGADVGRLGRDGGEGQFGGRSVVVLADLCGGGGPYRAGAAAWRACLERPGLAAMEPDQGRATSTPWARQSTPRRQGSPRGGERTRMRPTRLASPIWASPSSTGLTRGRAGERARRSAFPGSSVLTLVKAFATTTEGRSPQVPAALGSVLSSEGIEEALVDCAVCDSLPATLETRVLARERTLRIEQRTIWSGAVGTSSIRSSAVSP